MMKVPEVQAAMERTGVERKCYTTDEVATMLGISMKSVYQLLKQNALSVYSLQLPPFNSYLQNSIWLSMEMLSFLSTDCLA